MLCVMLFVTSMKRCVRSNNLEPGKNGFVQTSTKRCEEDVIEEKVDPGEYGLENRSCRWLCLFLFVLSVNHEPLGKNLMVAEIDPAHHLSCVDRQMPCSACRRELAEDSSLLSDVCHALLLASRQRAEVQT